MAVPHTTVLPPLPLRAAALSHIPCGSVGGAGNSTGVKYDVYGLYVGVFALEFQESVYLHGSSVGVRAMSNTRHVPAHLNLRTTKTASSSSKTNIG